MAKYLMKYKGTYRLKAAIDQSTNDYPRDDSGGIDPSFDDIYIKCYGGAQIYHYGFSTLVAYIPSIGRGMILGYLNMKLMKNYIRHLKMKELYEVSWKTTKK